jgi:lon-related putative ATP-dependent protease
MSAKNRIRIAPAQLTAAIPAGWLNFATTADLDRHLGMIGQERAMSAVEVGLKVRTRGYNIFAVGEPGSGKTSTLERLLRRRAADEPLPGDVCYVYNFATPDRPRPLILPAGQGRALAKDMDRIFVELGRLIPRVLSEGAFGHIRAGIIAETRRKMDDVTRRTSEIADRLGLKLEEAENQLRVVPLVGGEPVDESQILSLPARARRQIEQRMLEFHKHIDAFTYARRQLERAHDTRLLAAETRAVGPLVEELFHEISWRYRRHGEELATYLEQAKEFVLANHRLFTPDEEKDEKAANGAPLECEMPGPPSQPDPRLLLHVNVVVDRSAESGAPVVVERVPAAGNLCGVFEYRETPGGLVTDHTQIRAGALHQANGGYLLIQAIDLLTQENAWQSLKRALRHKEIRIEEGMGPSEARPRLAGALKPGAVPLNVKVILVGGYDVYYTLKTEDEEFQRLFKILADFEPSMPRTKENVVKLAKFCGQVCREEGYLPLHRSGMERIIEFASRRAESKERLITRWAEVLDLLAEANMFARATQARTIRSADVEAALTESDRRNGSLVDAVVREIQSGTIIIRTEGAAVGQINGIALYDVAGTTFGVPVRITARTYAGRRGVVNIDREVNLSGAVHDKGALILIGYLGGRFAQLRPLGFSASVTFEQSYDEIDGDSASSAELYALLSALADVPIKQGIAVTGSVNQLGELQPIGGVNEKIEGVFRVAAGRGLTGSEGVMIPASNVRNLMLRRDVIDAVRAGLFHVWAVSTIDEGIELLTGVEAGKRRQDGTWAPGSINDRVEKRLEQLLGLVREEPGASIPRGL